MLENIEDQKRALDEYHKLLRTSDRYVQINLLKNGFLPDHAKFLIDAGLHCVSLINEDEVAIGRSEAAVSRLETITMKLKLSPPDKETRKAAAMFQEKVDKFNQSQSMYTVFGFILIAFIIVAVVLAVMYFRS